MKNTKRIHDDIQENVKPKLEKTAAEFIPHIALTIEVASQKLSSRLQHLDGGAWHNWQAEVAKAEKIIQTHLAEELIIQLKKKFKINWQ